MFDCPALLNRCFGSHQLSNLDQEHCVELLSFRLFLDEKKLNAEAYLRTQFCEQFEFLWCSKSKLMGSIASGKICACWSCCIRVVEFLSLPWYWVGNLIQICGMKLLYLCCITVPQLKPDYMATSGAICRWLYSHQISDCLAISGAPYLLCGVKTSALSPILCYTSTPDGSFLCIRRRFSMHNLSFFWKC